MNPEEFRTSMNDVDERYVAEMLDYIDGGKRRRRAALRAALPVAVGAAVLLTASLTLLFALRRAVGPSKQTEVTSEYDAVIRVDTETSRFNYEISVKTPTDAQSAKAEFDVYEIGDYDLIMRLAESSDLPFEAFLESYTQAYLISAPLALVTLRTDYLSGGLYKAGSGLIDRDKIYYYDFGSYTKDNPLSDDDRCTESGYFYWLSGEPAATYLTY